MSYTEQFVEYCNEAIERHKSGSHVNLTGLLCEAIEFGLATCVEDILRHGADPNVRRSPHSLSPLTSAAIEFESEIVSLLLAAGARVNEVDHNCTPLEWTLSTYSSAPGSVDACEATAIMLINGGACVDGILNKTAVTERVTTALLDAGADPNEYYRNNRNEPMEFPLERVSRDGILGVAKLLLIRGANPNYFRKTRPIDRAIGRAMRRNGPEWVELLCAAGADLSHLANAPANWTDDAITEVLRKYGAPIPLPSTRECASVQLWRAEHRSHVETTTMAMFSSLRSAYVPSIVSLVGDYLHAYT